jgi:hypothetical protein
LKIRIQRQEEEKKTLFSVFLVGNSDTTDSLSSSTSSNTIARPLQTTHSIENMIPFPDTGDPTD